MQYWSIEITRAAVVLLDVVKHTTAWAEVGCDSECIFATLKAYLTSLFETF